VFCYQGDPLLCDLHTEVTLEEIKSQIALEHGKAITVNVRRADEIVLRKHHSVTVIMFFVYLLICSHRLQL